MGSHHKYSFPYNKNNTMPLLMEKMGIKGLAVHKVRTGLSMLGIVFGVCSVIAMLAIGTGASEEAQEQIRKLGVHNIIVRSVPPPTSTIPELLKVGRRPVPVNENSASD